ncbi:MAG: efflux RND transporter periplasmic adaptor subunit [Candidatus Competibacter sp.]|nr:efflux RND transporter periplasmic adaptor subunit [Candidatus Competibacter sp.]MDG4583205.1 efflux RND transporter periplasmic adaptor subunit [Candidatus Competibacter sp.]
MKKHGFLWTIIALGLLAAGGFWAWRLFGPLTVEVARPTRGPAVRAVYATGTVEPTVMLPIAPRNAGRLAELKADEGDRVRKDQVLAQMEDADLQRSVDELEARARFAKSQFDRAQTLYERKLGSLLERDQARSEWQAVEASLARARTLRGFMTLIAPADGQILQRDGEIGQMIPANQPIFYFSCCAPLRIEAEVDEEDILLVRPGQRTLIRAPALPDRVLEGEVAEITPKGNPVTRSYRVRIGFKDDTPLRIGMTTEVNIVVDRREDALLAPTTAVIDGHVWILQDGRLRRRAVETGIKGELKTEILSGLTEANRIVVRPTPELKEGRRVRAAAENSAPAAG